MAKDLFSLVFNSAILYNNGKMRNANFIDNVSST